MAVREVKRRGRRVLVIDIPYRKPDGTKDRYRRDTTAATRSAAREEEKRVRDRIARTGSPFEEPEPEAPAPPVILTFGQVVEQFCSTFMITDLKVTTRRSYKLVLNGLLLPRFKSRPINEMDSDVASKLDLELAQNGGSKKKQLSRSTRNNIQIVLRSVLRFAAQKGFLSKPPSQMPRLKRVEQTILEIPTDKQVQVILRTAADAQRRSFALMAFAGLRPNEVRALLWRDVDLRREKGEAVGGFLRIKEGRSFDQEHTPKTGLREIPIAPELARLLAPVANGLREDYVAQTEQGERWGQHGLDQAFKRVRDRAGFCGWSIYALRHYAITSWLRAGIPVHVVQKMAGHKHLSTTQRYVHHMKQDLEEAARRLAANGNIVVTASDDDPEDDDQS